ncbi:MAG: MarR family winged helix-turn-helix transcriptional regulator [Solirubrobacteraceae bacterium]
MSEPEDNISEHEDTSPVARAGEAPDGDLVDAAIRRWGLERPDLDLDAMAVIARLGRATAYIDAGINARLSEFGLSRSAWDVVASLRRQGEPYRLSPTALYVGLMRSSGAITHRLRGLERAGLIVRVPDPHDARAMLVQLTPQGVALTDRVAPLHLANERALLAALDEPEQRVLANILRKLLIAFESEQPVPPPSGRGGRPARPRSP